MRSPSRCARPTSSATARRRCATSTCSATTSPWAAPARAARTARACPSAPASRPCRRQSADRGTDRRAPAAASAARRPTAAGRSPTRSSPRRRPGEQIEAYVSRGGETEVRVYQGEVEHFVSAQSEGIGVRVIRDGRTGFAYAGTLDPAAVDEVLAEARDNVAFGTRRRVGRPRRARRRRPHPADAVGRLARRLPDRPQDRAGQGAGAADARRRPPRAGRRRQLRRRLGRGRRGDDRPASARPAARTAATSASAASPTTVTRRRPASASASAREPDGFDLEQGGA